MAETTPINEKIVERKTIIYTTVVDPTVVKVAGQKLKHKLFVRFGFLKPKPEEVEFVSIDKYYEPYLIISGQYSIEYFRKGVYLVNVDETVREVTLLNQKFRPEKAKESSAKGAKVIELEGEEDLLYEDKTSLVLDRSGREVPLERLPSAPSEEHPEKLLAELGDKARRLDVALDADVAVLRSKIVKRPKNIKRIIQELFEVDERALIYTPIYRVLFRNLKTGDVKALEFDGVTSERIQ